MKPTRSKIALLGAAAALFVCVASASATPLLPQNHHDDAIVLSYDKTYSADGTANLGIDGLASIFFSDVENMVIEKTVILIGHENPPPPPAPVPEPGTSLLLGVGLFGLAVYSKHRKST